MNANGRGVLVQWGTTRAKSMTLNGTNGAELSDTVYGDKTAGSAFSWKIKR
jgi:hypothetical protein